MFLHHHGHCWPLRVYLNKFKCNADYRARQYPNKRTVEHLKEHVLEGFVKYGIGKATSAGRIVIMAFERKNKKFVTRSVSQVIDFTGCATDDEE